MAILIAIVIADSEINLCAMVVGENILADNKVLQLDV
jgi:hypothetical protein